MPYGKQVVNLGNIYYFTIKKYELIELAGNFWIVAVIGFVASFFGSLMGIGGGIFIVPSLTLLLNLPIQVAVGCSLTTIVANSCIASYNYIRNELTNIRLSILLCSTVVPGAIAGSLIAAYIPSTALTVVFCAVLLGIAYSMLRRARKKTDETAENDASKQKSSITDRVFKTESYYDKNLRAKVSYKIIKTRTGLISSFFSGLLSSLLGVGGGIINVPVMTLLMRIPIKVAVATSSFMIMITAAAGAMVYYYHGLIFPTVVAALVIGVLAGSFTGSAALQRIQPKNMNIIFAAIVVVITVLMLLRLFNIL